MRWSQQPCRACRRCARNSWGLVLAPLIGAWSGLLKRSRNGAFQRRRRAIDDVAPDRMASVFHAKVTD